MTAVIATRSAGDRPADDIIEPLLSSIAARKERARVELERGEQKSPLTLTIAFRPALRLGHLVRVFDALLGAVWTGKATGIQHQVQDGVPLTVLTLERPDE